MISTGTIRISGIAILRPQQLLGPKLNTMLGLAARDYANVSLSTEVPTYFVARICTDGIELHFKGDLMLPNRSWPASIGVVFLGKRAMRSIPSLYPLMLRQSKSKLFRIHRRTQTA